MKTAAQMVFFHFANGSGTTHRASSSSNPQTYLHFDQVTDLWVGTMLCSGSGCSKSAVSSNHTRLFLPVLHKAIVILRTAAGSTTLGHNGALAWELGCQRHAVKPLQAGSCQPEWSPPSLPLQLGKAPLDASCMDGPEMTRPMLP